MAVVHRARHTRSGLSVAVKLMTTEHAESHAYRRAFRTEVEAAARLSHPRIVTLLDYGIVSARVASQHELLEGAPYIAMEFVDGVPLNQTLVDDWQTLRKLTLQLLDALAHAHALGIIHRDLKPGNVLVERHSHSLKLTDFGIARTYGHEAPEGSDEEVRVTGTPRYMAPEQILAEGREQGPWTDLYSLGIMIWRLASGGTPYDGDTTQILAGHLHEPLPELEPRFGVPPRFGEWLSGMLAKRPGNRFRRAADAAQALLELGDFDEDESTPLRATREDFPTLATVVEATILIEAQSGTRPRVHHRAGEQNPAIVETRPPLDFEWRKFDYHDGMKLADAGLGLFGLRTPPFVDRDTARDLLWDRLGRTFESGTPHGVALKGAGGTGKTRISAWLARRAHELGAATILKASHSPADSQNQGMESMLEMFLRTRGLDRKDVLERIESIYTDMGYRRDVLELDCMAMREIVAPPETEHERAVTFQDPEERYLTVFRLLEAIARERPVILRVEDAQWANDISRLLELIFEHQIPVLTIMTMRSEPDEATDRGLQEICGRYFETIEIEALSHEDRRRLVRGTLPLASRTVEQVAKISEGNPLFALQMLGEWVSNGLLESGPDGFELSDAANVPDDLDTLSRRRMERLFEDTTDPESARDALVLAAALGPDIDESEWFEMVPDIPIASALEDGLCSLGIAERHERGWRFAQGFYHHAARRLARDAGRWKAANRTLAAALDRPWTQDRRASHLAEAGDYDAAYSAYIDAAEQAMAANEVQFVARLLDRASTVRARLETREDDPRLYRMMSLRARVAGEVREYETSTNLHERVLAASRKFGWRELEARTMLSHAHQALRMGDIQQSVERYQDAEARFRELDHRWGINRALEGRSFALLHIGETHEAMRLSIEARDGYRKLDDWRGIAYSAFHLGMGARLLGDLDAARSHYEEAHRIARKHGYRDAMGEAVNSLGDLERAAGNLDEAQALYTEARNIWQALGTTGVDTATMNLGLVAMDRGEHPRAIDLIEPLRNLYAEKELNMALNITLHMLIEAYAATENRAEFDRAVEEISQLEENFLIVDPDLAECAEAATEWWLEWGDATRAELAREVARTQWREIGDDQRTS